MYPKEQAEFFEAKETARCLRPSVVVIPEEPIDTASGLRWLFTQKIPILDSDGTPIHLLGIRSTSPSSEKEALRKARDHLELRVQERPPSWRAPTPLTGQIDDSSRVEEALLRAADQLRQAQNWRRWELLEASRTTSATSCR